MSSFTKATKSQLRARVVLDGPTGSGKTWTGLEWATVLGKRIAGIDSERERMRLYANRFDFDWCPMVPPFTPDSLVAKLQEAEQERYDVVLIDSLSHFWEGEGGVLDIVDAAAQRAQGNSFAGWKVGTPALRRLVDVMLGLDCHLVVTMRSKMEYVVELNTKTGKNEPRRVGMAPVMRSGVEYEFDLIGDMDLEHRIVLSKSRCDVLADQVVQPHRAKEAAGTFKEWLDDGEPTASRDEVAGLRARIAELPDAMRDPCRRLFKEAFGRPDTLAAKDVPAAQAFVAEYEADAEWVAGQEAEAEDPALEPPAA